MKRILVVASLAAAAVTGLVPTASADPICVRYGEGQICTVDFDFLPVCVSLGSRPPTCVPPSTTS